MKHAEFYNALHYFASTDNTVQLMRDMHAIIPGVRLEGEIQDLWIATQELIKHGPADDPKWANLCALPTAVAYVEAYLVKEVRTTFEDELHPDGLSIVVYADGLVVISDDPSEPRCTFRRDEVLKRFNFIINEIRKQHGLDN